jgi:hypothetical protein
MFADDPVALIALALVIFAIVLAVAVGIRRRRTAPKRRSLRRALDRMSARITALELAYRQHLLTKLESTPSVPDNVADATPVPPVVAVSSQEPRVRQMRTRHLNGARAAMMTIVWAMMSLLVIIGLGAAVNDALRVSDSSTNGVGFGPPRR